jgi:hypothetical protein
LVERMPRSPCAARSDLSQARRAAPSHAMARLGLVRPPFFGVNDKWGLCSEFRFGTRGAWLWILLGSRAADRVRRRMRWRQAANRIPLTEVAILLR